jgi:hypothetical protein
VAHKAVKPPSRIRKGNSTCIEATAMALDVSPMGVGLDSENGPLHLPVSSKLAPEKPAIEGAILA